MNSLYSWQGGKFFEKNIIIPLIPKHYWYVETFFGSGILLLNKPIAKREFGNDKFSCLVNFWNVIHEARLARKLMKLCENTLDSKFHYEEYMKLDPNELTKIDRAYRFMYLTAFGFSSYHDTYYTPITHKIDKIKDHLRTFKVSANRIMKIHNRVKNVMFTNYDFLDCINKVKPEKGKFFFCDPPYINTHGYNRGYCDNLDFPVDRYVDMRNALKTQHDGGSMWMITCNQENTYFDEMDDIIIKLIERRSCINKNKERRPVKTKVIMNYDVEEVGSCLKMLDDKEIKEEKKSGSALMI